MPPMFCAGIAAGSGVFSFFFCENGAFQQRSKDVAFGFFFLFLCLRLVCLRRGDLRLRRVWLHAVLLLGGAPARSAWSGHDPRRADHSTPPAWHCTGHSPTVSDLLLHWRPHAPHHHAPTALLGSHPTTALWRHPTTHHLIHIGEHHLGKREIRFALKRLWSQRESRILTKRN